MRLKLKPILLVVLLLGLGAALLAQQAVARGQTADPTYYLPVVMNGSTVSQADQAAQRISVPAGFAIRIFAQGLAGPRFMAVGPDGQLYVALSGGGQIVRLPDQNHDGRSDGTQVVISGLNHPHNLEWHAGWMYVAEEDKIERFADKNSDGVYETRQVVVNNLPTGGHSSRTLHFGPDGMMYVSVGSSCNICVEADARRAAILRYTPDGGIPADNPTSGSPVWASGLRNAVDFLWTPNGQLWADQNGSDGLGDNVPPEEVVNVIQKGRWYGWPYCYTPKLGLNQPAQPEVRDSRLPLPSGVTCAQSTPALFTDSAHYAPLGMVLGTKSSFPAEYRDDLFVAYHGSWNTSSPANYRDCKVERIIIQNGAITGSQTFANGWRAPGEMCGGADTWGRPAGLIFGSDGALYISDDAGGRVYRVTGPQ